MTHELINKLHKSYLKGGCREVVTEFWVNLTKRGPLSEVIPRVTNETLHEKLIMAPKVGYWPHLKNPRTFNEYIAHRKLFTNNDTYTKLSDKYRVRDFVSDCVSEDILTETYFVGSNPDNIPFNKLPKKYIIKPNHGSGWNITWKNSYTKYEIKNTCHYWIKTSYGEKSREYWYNNIEPKIIIEEFIESPSGTVPTDYKFFVFDGSVEYIQVDHNRKSNHTRRIYNENWEPEDFRLDYPIAPVTNPPPNLEELIEIAEKLGQFFDFVRVDLYNPYKNSIYFGELTFAPGSGQERFFPKKKDFEFGEKWSAGINDNQHL
ncbi:ATP-grasp fold amidoligase family protein [Halorubrum ezzemoulense]|uniref:ATP-grasp fold amidoligase family protein n=1 Tax=Halorubrum ezzemoulense TaxID=337243 RepID=UPI00232B50C2|nr:ATP-grasp fold amidoligase family protein [Halorubrum ezzemoulense]MDB2252501.1 ATP-grasp fold amidoligase family protein [Halorubrum ezzemoulense]